jgi:hypothetical protein
MQRQQVAQCIDRQMDFAALFTFMPLIAGSLTAFWGRLQSPPIENCRRWLLGSTRHQSQQHPQIVDHRFKVSTNPIDMTD